MIRTTLLSLACAPSFDAITSCSPVKISRAEAAEVAVAISAPLSEYRMPFHAYVGVGSAASQAATAAHFGLLVTMIAVSAQPRGVLRYWRSSAPGSAPA